MQPVALLRSGAVAALQGLPSVALIGALACNTRSLRLRHGLQQSPENDEAP